jgi:GTPase SAR1 family protein
LESFKNAPRWLDEAIMYCKPGTQKLFIANKCDLENEIKVEKEMENKLFEKNKIEIIETSAKENINIEESFINMIKIILCRDNPHLKEYLESPNDWKSEIHHIFDQDFKNCIFIFVCCLKKKGNSFKLPKFVLFQVIKNYFDFYKILI